MDPWISLITLGVRDLARSRRFYQDGLGWPLSTASSEQVAFFRTGGVVLALYPRTSLAADADLSPVGSGFAGIALAHNVPARERVDAALEAAVAAGSTCSSQALRPSGAATPPTSPTPTGISGRSPGTRDFLYGKMGRSIYRSQRRPIMSRVIVRRGTGSLTAAPDPAHAALPT